MQSPTHLLMALAAIWSFGTLLVAETKEPPPAEVPVPQVAWLGVYVDTVPEALRAQLDIGKTSGILVDSVVAGSPAEMAGLRAYDVLLSFEDQRLFNRDQLQALVSETTPGAVVTFQIVRGGKQQALPVTLGSRDVKPKKPSRWESLNISQDIREMLQDITENPEIRAALSEAEGEIEDPMESISESLPSDEEIRENIEHALNSLKETGAQIRDIEILGGSDEKESEGDEVMRRSRILSDATEVNYEDSHGAIAVTVNANTKTVEITDSDGEVVYKGPLDSNTLQALERKDSERLKNLLKMHKIELAATE